MSGGSPRGGGEQERVVVGTRGEVSGGRGGSLSFYHVPQQCRREKLRYPNANERPPWQPHTPPPRPPLLYGGAPLSAATVAPTASFMPASSSHVLNPSSDTAPPNQGITISPVQFLGRHPLLGGVHHHQGQGVSLSLSSSTASPSQHNDQQHHGEVACALALTGQLPLAPTAPRTAPVPIGPFTGYATVLEGSRFLTPAQQLLEEVCGGGCNVVGTTVRSGGEEESLDHLAAVNGLDECGEVVDGLIAAGEGQKMMSRLISILDEVCRRYKQYSQQIQAVIMSFEAVAGLKMAMPYTPLALRSLSKHFRCLKNVISGQLRIKKKALGKEVQSEDGMPGYSFMNGGFRYRIVTHTSSAINQQPVWRPQRGLPECAVAVLRAWLFEHFLHPYPTDMDKQMLAKQTGLSRNQVSNWFINARVRLWKPMVEEIHSLELQQACKIPETDSGKNTNKHTEFSSTSAVSPNNKQLPFNVSSQKILDHPHKRFRDDLVQLPNHMKEPLNIPLEDLSVNHRVAVPIGFSTGPANGGISLTLGLHQNDVCSSELPLNVVQRFGLEENTVAYVMGGLGQERHLDFDRQFLNHFVA